MRRRNEARPGSRRGTPPALLPALAVLAVLVSLLLPPLPAGATSAVLLEDDELVDRSQLVVTGRCTGTETVRVDRSLLTLARFRVDEVLKDTQGAVAGTTAEVTVVLPGGVDPSAPFPVAEVWPGAPSLVAGEEALLFLRPYQPLAEGWTVVGFSQGKFGIDRDAEPARVERNLSGSSLWAPDGTVREGQAREEALADLVRRVRLRVAGSGDAR